MQYMFHTDFVAKIAQNGNLIIFGKRLSVCRLQKFQALMKWEENLYLKYNTTALSSLSSLAAPTKVLPGCQSPETSKDNSAKFSVVIISTYRS